MIRTLLALLMVTNILPVSKVSNDKKLNINEINFQYSSSEVKLILSTDMVLDNSSRVTINISGYGLDDDNTFSNTYTYIANSSKIYISFSSVKAKTLFEIQAHYNLYPELKSTYNFILFPAGKIVENHSINPIKINYLTDTIFYEEFNFQNINKVAEYSLFSNIFLLSEDTIKSGNAKVYISLPVEGEREENNFYKLDAEFKDGKLLIKNCYYDFINRTINYEKGFKVNSINFPVPSFTLKIILDNLGSSLSTYELVQNYSNTKSFFGECEVSSFCFI